MKNRTSSQTGLSSQHEKTETINHTLNYKRNKYITSFYQWRIQNFPEGALTSRWGWFSPKDCMKMKEIGPRGDAPLDPPLFMDVLFIDKSPIDWSTNSVNQDNIEDSVIKPKGVFKTTKHGIKDERYFKCPKCRIHKSSTSKLNDHCKRRHDPLQCSKCSMSFSTPSGLNRHKNMHAAQRHFCPQCGKGFHFLGQLNQHSLMHHTIPTHICSFGKCRKSYLSNADLLKHVRTHKAKEQKCDKCDYCTKDKKLIQSHQHIHEDFLRYECANCGMKFWHRNQIRCHKNNPKKCVKQSNSRSY